MRIAAHRHLLLETLAVLVLGILLPTLALLQYRWIERLAQHERESREQLARNAALGLQGEVDARVAGLLAAMQRMAAPGAVLDLEAEHHFMGQQLATDIYFVAGDPSRTSRPLWRLRADSAGRFAELGWAQMLQSTGPLGVAIATRGFGGSLSVAGTAPALAIAASARLPGESQPLRGVLVAPLDAAALTELIRRLSRTRIEPALGDSLKFSVVGGRETAALPLLDAPQFSGQPAAGYFRLGLRHGAGSAGAVAEALRRRNLAVAFGVLLLLGASAALLWLTARRARALAAQRLQMVAAVSHEMRTPLAIIHSAAANLADGVVPDADRAREYGALIRSESQRMKRLVDNALHLGGVAQPRAEGDHRTSLDALLPGLLQRYSDPPGSIEVEGDAATLPPLTMAPADLELVLANLLDNARRYRDSDAPVRLSLQRRGAWLRLAVANRCSALDAGESEQVFDPFFRGRHARSVNGAGSGLGLSLVQSIVTRCGGRIACRHLRGDIVFELDLPLQLREARR
jgi:signal transduction histidine kinase